MKATNRYLPTALVIGGFALLLFYAFLQLVSIQRSINTKLGENMLWMITQTEREALRVSEAVLAVTLNLDSQDELSLRLDLLYSRLTLLAEPKQAQWFDRIGATPIIQRNIERLSELADLIDHAAGPDQIDLITTQKILRPMVMDLGHLTNQTLLADRDQKSLQRTRERETMYLIMAAFAGLFLAGTFLSWQLLHMLRIADRTGLELRQHKAQLEETVARRTAELHSALDTERHAKEIYRSFITTVSHQFRTPLSIIDLIAQRLIRRPEDFSQVAVSNKARKIRSSVQRLTQLIASVTNAARLDEGELALARRRVDLNDILRAAITFSCELNPGRQLLQYLSETPLPCDSDAALVEQVVLNLLSNAVKYSPHDTPIEIRSWQERGFCFCQVRDHGIGIPLKDQPRIFQRFYRAGNASPILGSGLGLSLSRTIIDLHGGKLYFTSQEGVGTVVTFCLPRSTEEEGEPAMDLRPDPHPRASRLIPPPIPSSGMRS